MTKDNLVYLRHILDAIGRIEEYTKGVKRDDFMGRALVQAGVVRELEIIGEATKGLATQIKNKHPKVPWKKIAGMRDKLIHNYFGVDLDAVWETVERDIPALKSQIQDIMKDDMRMSGDN